MFWHTYFCNLFNIIETNLKEYELRHWRSFKFGSAENNPPRSTKSTFKGKELFIYKWKTNWSIFMIQMLGFGFVNFF